MARKNGYAVELSFDAATDAAVRRVWDELAREGACDFMTGFGVHPHVSLAVFDDLALADTEPELAGLARQMTPLPIVLSTIGIFAGSAGVVFLGAVVTDELLAAHAELHRRLRPMSRGPWSYYDRGEWVPHCTLTQGMPVERIPRAVEIARRAPLPLRGMVERVSLVKFHPPEVLFSTNLAQPVARFP